MAESPLGRPLEPDPGSAGVGKAKNRSLDYLSSRTLFRARLFHCHEFALLVLVLFVISDLIGDPVSLSLDSASAGMTGDEI